MNSYEYATRMKTKSLANYLEENDIRYIISSRPAPAGKPVVAFRGLVVPQEATRTLIRPPGKLRRPVAYTLYEVVERPQR